MRPFLLWIAWKQVFSKRKKAGLFFMTLASMFGISVGIGALIVTLSVMGGFERELTEKIFFGLPHVEYVSQNAAEGISLVDHPLAKFAKALGDDVEVGAYIKEDVIVKRKSRYASGTFLGLDPRKNHDIWAVRASLVGVNTLEELLADHGEGYPSVILGAELAAQLNLYVGDTLSVISPKANLSGFLAGDKLVEKFKVVGLFQSGREEYDGSYVISGLEHARKFMHDYDVMLDKKEYVSGVAAVFSDPHEVGVRGVDTSFLSQFSELSWKEVNKSLLLALLLEKLAMSVVLFLIVVVAIFSLSGTVMMTVYHQKAQISLLRGLGMTWKDVVKVFVAHGTLIGGVGIVLGLMVGFLACWLILTVGVITLPQGLYTLQKLPVEFLWYEYGVICVSALVLTVLASVYPAYMAGRQKPAEGLRFSG